MLELFFAVATKETLSRSGTSGIIHSGSDPRPVSDHEDSSSGGGKQIPPQEPSKIHDATRSESSGLPWHTTKREKLPPMTLQEIRDHIDNAVNEARDRAPTVRSPSIVLLSGSSSPSSSQSIFPESTSSIEFPIAPSQSEVSLKLPKVENIDFLSPVTVKKEPVEDTLSDSQASERLGIYNPDFLRIFPRINSPPHENHMLPESDTKGERGCATTPPTSSIANLRPPNLEYKWSDRRSWEIAVSPSGFTVREPLNSRQKQKSAIMTTDGYSRHNTLKRSRAEDDDNGEEEETPAPSLQKRQCSSYSEANSAATSEPDTSLNRKAGSSRVNSESPLHNFLGREGGEDKIRDQQPARSRKRPRISSSNVSDSGFDDGDDPRAWRHPCRIRSKTGNRDADLIGHTPVNLVHTTVCGTCDEVIEPRRDTSKSHERRSLAKSKRGKDSSD